MRAALLTLAGLAACWPAWLAAGWLAETLLPAGLGLLPQAGLLILMLGPLARLLDHLAARWEPEHHG